MVASHNARHDYGSYSPNRPLSTEQDDGIDILPTDKFIIGEHDFESSVDKSSVLVTMPIRKCQDGGNEDAKNPAGFINEYGCRKTILLLFCALERRERPQKVQLLRVHMNIRHRWKTPLVVMK